MASSIPSFFLFLELLVVPFCAVAQTRGNIALGSYLVALNNNTSWKSPSGDFAFGFRQIGRGGGFLLSIWFDKIPEKTIIWSANGNDLAPKGSRIQLGKDGLFVLTDPRGRPIWTANPGGAAHAAMLDTGNFVLISRNSVSLWQSFEHPTDTMLPTQILNPGSRLIARFSQTSYSNGRFQLLFQPEGNLSLYTTSFPLDSINSPYWSADGTSNSGARTIFRPSGNVELTAENGETIATVLPNAAPTDYFYQRATLDYNGVFGVHIYPRIGRSNSSKNQRPMSWSPLSHIPSDICSSITQSTGGGACGFNSYCNLNGGRPICECPTGYTLFDPTDKLAGCKAEFKPQSCNGGLRETALFELREMANTDWPLNDYEYYRVVSEEWCKGACLNDCLCAVAIFRDGKCWKKRSPVSNGRVNPSVGGKALIKVRK